MEAILKSGPPGVIVVTGKLLRKYYLRPGLTEQEKEFYDCRSRGLTLSSFIP
jgi:hypothetical protein